MAHPTPENGSNVWTIGHSNHSEDAFFDLLRMHDIQVIADVRSSPYSKYASHFNKEAVQHAAREAGLRYVFLGDLLGGRAEDDQFYDDQGHVLYGKLALSDAFQQGLKRLLEGLGSWRVALMCGEEDPTHCHRRLLIGRVLTEQDIRVMHIRGDGRIQTEDEVARAEEFARTKGQRTLFDMEEADEWKSTQSVLPRKAPPSSSEP